MTLVHVLIGCTIILLGICIWLGYTLRKIVNVSYEQVTQLEKSNEELLEFVGALQERVKQVIIDIDRIDETGAFRTEDWVGATFSELVNIIHTLNQFAESENAQKKEITN